MSVYFHANFNLNRDRLSRILNYLIKQTELNDDQIANKFGYKAPFTKRYKSWLKKCGLIEYSTKFNLTEYGKVIYKKDAKLSKAPTLWYMHNFLTSSEDNAEAWNFFFHDYLPKVNNFSKNDLKKALSMKLMPHDPRHFGNNAPMINVISKVLIDSYISEEAFGTLNILKFNGESFNAGPIKSPYEWNDVNTFNKLY